LVELGALTYLCGLGFLRPADECRLADRHAELPACYDLLGDIAGRRAINVR
jgi:hypothetical protein